MTDIKALLAASGMTQKAFADYLNVPLRTIESWASPSDRNRRKCPEYVAELIEYKMLKEGIIQK